MEYQSLLIFYRFCKKNLEAMYVAAETLERKLLQTNVETFEERQNNFIKF